MNKIFMFIVNLWRFFGFIGFIFVFIFSLTDAFYLHVNFLNILRKIMLIFLTFMILISLPMFARDVVEIFKNNSKQKKGIL